VIVLSDAGAFTHSIKAKEKENGRKASKSRILARGNKAMNASWNGSPSVLLIYHNLAMPRTPNGTAIVAATNQSPSNQNGTMRLSSGGAPSKILTIPAKANLPTIFIRNGHSNNLTISNISAPDGPSILVQMIGPGIAGVTALNFPIGTPTALSAGQAASGNATAQWMHLVIQSTAPTLGVLGIIGGPANASGDNGYVIAINAAQNTGPGGPRPPDGYYATTKTNSYTFVFNWGAAPIFIANLSPSTAQPLSIVMSATV
jgi:hypothetical protein